MKDMVLVVSSPQPQPNPGNGAGELAVIVDGREVCRKMVAPGTSFTGREGRFHAGTAREERTGWHEPAGFLPAGEAIRLTAASLWDEASHEWTDESRLAEAACIVEHYRCSGPEDFPGLTEHYPECGVSPHGR